MVGDNKVSGSPTASYTVKRAFCISSQKKVFFFVVFVGFSGFDKKTRFFLSKVSLFVEIQKKGVPQRLLLAYNGETKSFTSSCENGPTTGLLFIVGQP